jgi:hypothetical protein
MNTSSSGPISPDPAGVFAAAHSLWTAIFESSDRPEKASLSHCYQGLDQLMRDVLRVGLLFETWSCRHIAFDEVDEVWPYFVADNLGTTWLRIFDAYSLGDVNERDCLHAAWHLRLPIRMSEEFVLPVTVDVGNPNADTAFVGFRIQTTRTLKNGSRMMPFTVSDELFDESYVMACYSLYGRTGAGDSELLASRATYSETVSLAKRLVKNVEFPSAIICRR